MFLIKKSKIKQRPNTFITSFLRSTLLTEYINLACYPFESLLDFGRIRQVGRNRPMFERV